MARLSPSAMRAISASSVVSRTGALARCEATSRRTNWFCMTIPRSQARGVEYRGAVAGVLLRRCLTFLGARKMVSSEAELFRGCYNFTRRKHGIPGRPACRLPRRTGPGIRRDGHARALRAGAADGDALGLLRPVERVRAQAVAADRGEIIAQ